MYSLLTSPHAEGAPQVIAAFQQDAAQRSWQLSVQQARGGGIGHRQLWVEAADEAVSNLNRVRGPDVFYAGEELLREGLLQAS